MAKQLKIYRDFSGGLSEVANDNMLPRQLRTAKNVVPSERYGIAKAHGYEIAFPQISGGEEVVAIVALTPATGSTQTLAFTPTSLYKLASGTPDTWSLIDDEIGEMESYFIYANKLYFLDGTDYWVYDGTTLAAVTFNYAGETPTSDELATTAKIEASSYVEQRGQRWFFSQSGGNEVIFSDIGDPTAFDPLNIININTKDADTITGLCELNNGLVIFKEKGAHYLSGWDFSGGTDIELTQLSVTSGTKFHKSIQRIENAILYLGYNGVYRLRVPSLSETIAADNLSEGLISNTLRDFAATDARACVWDGDYRLTLENASETKEYRYNTATKAFFGEYTQAATCYSTALQDSKLYVGCANGYILEDDDTSYHYIDTDTGEDMAIEMEATTKSFDITGLMSADARVKRLFIIAKQYESESSTPTITITADYLSQSFEVSFDESLVWGEGIWGEAIWGWVDTVTKELRVNLKAKRVQIKIANNTVDEPTLVYGIGILYKPKRPKGNREGITEV